MIIVDDYTEEIVAVEHTGTEPVELVDGQIVVTWPYEILRRIPR